MCQKKTLIILSKSFGTNFSGGTSATHHIFISLQDRFEKIIFLGKEIGEHEFDNLTFIKYSSIFHALNILARLKRSHNIIGYGDFYMSYYFILTAIPYYFTYHDNWPEMKSFGWHNWLKSFFFMPVYRAVIRYAEWTFTVSHYKHQFIRLHTEKSSVVRNGIVNQTTASHSGTEAANDGIYKVLMVGNIDDRKFRWAIELFDLIKNDPGGAKIRIDIFGNTVDQSISSKLENYDFVAKKGFSKNIAFGNYDILLSTSYMENLAITVVEALKHHLPVVAFDVGGLSEVIENGKNGILISPGKVQEMFEILNNLTDHGREFSFNDHQLLEYDWKIAAKKYADVILGANEQD